MSSFKHKIEKILGLKLQYLDQCYSSKNCLLDTIQSEFKLESRLTVYIRYNEFQKEKVYNNTCIVKILILFMGQYIKLFIYI